MTREPRDYFGGRIPGWLIGGPWVLPTLAVLGALFLLAMSLVPTDTDPGGMRGTETRRSSP